MEQTRQASRLPYLLALVISLALLIPGISQPLMTFEAGIQRQALISEGKKLLNEQSIHPTIMSMANQFLDGVKVDGEYPAYKKTRSIIGTASDLWNFGFKLVAVLILTFSVVVPLIKTLLLGFACHPASNEKALKVNALLGKWSMADVFAMGVFIAMLAANGSSQGSALISFHAELHAGFYWFLAYCLVSSLAGQYLLKNRIV
ncbi:paraquat-inducible membrane protein A [Endozoicomonas sp. OPT23]|uniref:paraquat-inducible protein A n=1 Tax=Endozoicomonas sp. OPT23 TaxID=2072845 RepID=UPI00129A84C5|nr:paraquat-inducible protein A [Endozoicomonas sp. OPT23]MRI35039.1 paraquat-inducible membrane protein A [Endozoicomonas sp. OPT23]